MYRKQVRRRRAILLALVAISLTMLSVYFGEGQTGPLHRIQRVMAAGLGPFEEITGRSLKPARDLINWFDETFEARGKNEGLQNEVTDLRDKLAETQTQLRQQGELGKLAELTGGGLTPAGMEPVTARVIGRSPTVWYSTVTIDKGTSAGVRLDDPVIASDGLAGRVTSVSGGSAQVTLITDSASSVAGRVLPEGSTGVVEPDIGDPSKLQLNFVQRGDEIAEGEEVVTAGFSTGPLNSLFPPGIPIGTVTDSSLAEQQAYQRITLRAFADLRDMEFVQVLITPEGK